MLVKKAMEFRVTDREKEQKELDEMIQALRLEISSYNKKLDQMRSELVSRMDPVVQAVVKMETAIQQLQEGFSEI